MTTNSHNLQLYLKSKNCFIVPEEYLRRKEVVEELNMCFTNWVLTKIPSDRHGECSTVTGRVLTLGSQELGINGPGADIDILLVVGSRIKIDDFFSSFYDHLREHFQEKMSFCRKIENTYVPVIKATISKTDIDMAFCCFCLSNTNIPSVRELMDDINLKEMDIYSVRSLNGYRDCAEILNNTGSNIEKFQLVLRAVKLWASRRAIYNNSIGYFSGMALTVLVAKIIMEFPGDHDPFSLLIEFFKKYSNWLWPRPVMLHHLESNNKEAPVLKIWNPHIYSFDKEDKMPIITPAYPQRNSSYTATISTRRVIIKEFKRAAEKLTDEIIKKNSGSNPNSFLDAIFEPQEFFTEMHFQYYIILSAESHATDAHFHWDWCAVARSQIRKLVNDMELQNPVLILHVCPNAYPHPDSVSLPQNHFHSHWYIGMMLNKNYTIHDMDIPGCLLKFEKYVEDYAESHGIEMSGRSVRGKLIEGHYFQSHLPTGIERGVKGSTSLIEGRKGYFQFKSIL